MLIGRLVGWIFVLGGLTVAVREGMKWQETGELALESGGQLWFTLHADSINVMQAVVQRFAAPEIWDPGIQTILTWPALPTLLVPGLILLGLFRRRR